MPLLKICGLRDPGQALAVADLGADAIGVIGVPGSPRFLDPSRRRDVFTCLASRHPHCLRVLVVADPTEAELEPLDPAAGHGVLQLHGSESVERCRELRERFGGALWKALRIRSPKDLELAAAYAEVVDELLLDAWVPDQLGGTGHRIPSEWLLDFTPSVPWWLAGGITPERTPDLLKQVRPNGLDASSGVEAAPGVKDLKRVEDLVKAVRAHGP